MCVKDHVLKLFMFISLVLLQAPDSEGQSQVVGASQPVVGKIGEAVVIPCHLEPATKASDMTVEWTRHGLHPRFVHVWRDSEELEHKQHPSYRGRTSLFINKLKLGDISLKISKVKLSDEGRYRCFVPGLGESSVELLVGAVTSPFIISIDRTSDGLVLQCKSEGWYPEPEVFWLDAEGNLLPAGPTETVKGPGDLYTVSSRVTVEKRHSSSFTCRVHQKNINQTRETEIHIAADFFKVCPTSTVWIVICVIALVIFILCAFSCWKRRHKKSGQNLRLKTLMENEVEEEQHPRGKRALEGQNSHVVKQILD